MTSLEFDMTAASRSAGLRAYWRPPGPEGLRDGVARTCSHSYDGPAGLSLAAGYDVRVFVAITRAVSPALASCELTHLERAPIDVERARQQHRAYEQALIAAGGMVQRLER